MMIRHPRKAGKQNMGFSLVEVLVTLALISVLSIPLIQTFINSARVNGKAKSMPVSYTHLRAHET